MVRLNLLLEDALSDTAWLSPLKKSVTSMTVTAGILSKGFDLKCSCNRIKVGVSYSLVNGLGRISYADDGNNPHEYVVCWVLFQI